jgi:hypothetical protein
MRKYLVANPKSMIRKQVTGYDRAEYQGSCPAGMCWWENCRPARPELFRGALSCHDLPIFTEN